MTVGTLLILLAIGGFFFLMMRGRGGGCCGGHHGNHKSAHPSDHGNHNTGEEKTSSQAGPAKDPVCGMEIGVGSNTPESRYKNRAFYFCSEHCKETFERDPERFLP